MALAMNNSTIAGKNTTSDLVVNLHTQRTKILARINQNKDIAGPNLANDNTIRRLEREYNDVTDQIAQLERQPSSDPMRVLPLELCADIINEALDRYPSVDKLLDFTTVSRRWCNILMSLPTLWTTIVLDSHIADYLAKAATGLRLSGACELSVIISISFEMWREVSPIILAESGRIVSLHIYLLVTMAESEKILNEFGGLPVLKTLQLPLTTNYTRPYNNPPPIIEYEKMPLLSEITGLKPEPLESSCSRFVKSREFRLPMITQDMVNVWAKLPNLVDLTIYEDVSPDYWPKRFDSALLSVRRFKYYGMAMERALNLLGPNVRSITVEVSEFGQVLDLVGRFPRLDEFGLVLSESFRYGEMPKETIPTAHHSIETLSIHGPAYDRTYIADHEGVAILWRSIYQALVDILPFVRTLYLEYGLFVDVTWSYISSLKHLQGFRAFNCILHCLHSQNIVTMESLSSAIWSVAPWSRLPWSMLPDSIVFFSKIMGPNLRSLRVDVTQEGGMSTEADSTAYIILENAFPRLASLTIIFAKSVPWNIGVHKNLRELVLNQEYDDLISLMTRNDILEIILMRPRDFPALETVQLTGFHFESDILLLMLERKNIYAQPGISPIKTLTLRTPTPYHLLCPITTLLRGEFPDREPNVAFSLEAVRERIFDESSTGCETCCYGFRRCSVPILAGPSTPPAEPQDEDLIPKYMAKSIVADPPLTLDVKEWLAEKSKRRLSFLRSHQETKVQFHRTFRCPEVTNQWPTPITGSSLDGVG
ncbi:hypothetical protein M408DRAFT_20123 [Serendipita vermifera MAFF 305830]|uniref:F-box domain-containing protein n=1 Tax=Serendipita vermifera MAFF 305830 TaxID=933852 RepID=A0A0C3BMV7_SERVB|nr:hypothetical protein M408DRAFT_20123 [Serendipita vermifera MAFF 305830]